MENVFLAASMMCADFTNLETEVKQLDEAGIDCFHIDIMDGNFVPNFGMGLMDLETIRILTQRPVDAHLMIANPGNYIDFFKDKGVNIIYFHPEADLHPVRTILKIKERGIKAGIAVNPGTSMETIQELLPIVDIVLVMTVNPGFAGQKYLEFVDNKINRIVSKKEEYDFKIYVDGAISAEKVRELSRKGVEGFILGTSCLFKKMENYRTIIERLKAANRCKVSV
ncbi:ribulose-phosphate 3-epimerase [Cytobacillus sp. Hz8]|uniref:ribulose-phosphate 3-epimerase n=1 Tax=Cytobacillus sp. Hz8 TaxID=3347168 RepID=UPI0035DA0711